MHWFLLGDTASTDTCNHPTVLPAQLEMVVSYLQL